MKKYLLFVTLPYAYSILRPLEDEIRRRGDEAAWFVEPDCPVALRDDEIRLRTVRDVIDYDPIAVFAPGNYIPDFFPGVKVALFHWYAIQKRYETMDDHFTIRGWFDLYCTQGPSSTPVFKELERKYGFFRIITFHPKLTDPEIIAGYKKIAEENANVTFFEGADKLQLLHKADVMLCDSSSIILEFMFLDKPVVTFRNSHPGPHLIDVQRPEEVGPALERALTRPDELMREVRTYTMFHEPHRDCRCSARVLDAVDDFLERGHVGLKRKPLNLIRKWKVSSYPFTRRASLRQSAMLQLRGVRLGASIR